MKIPSPLVSLLPVAVLVVLLFFTIRLLGADALGGGSQICLLLTTALCAALGMSRYGVSWKDIEHAIINNIAGVSSALIILLIIGLDVRGRGTYADLLWGTDYSSEIFPRVVLCDLCSGIGHDRQFVDHHCDHRYCLDGYRQGTGF